MRKIKILTRFAAAVFCGFFFISTFAATFPDVPTSSPQAVAIDYLTTEGILGGYPDGNFRPDQPVNRAEALKILLLATNISTSGGFTDFPDVAAEAWFAPFVSAAVGGGIAAGYPDGNFRPAQTVNLVESLKMLTLASGVDTSSYATDEQLAADTQSAAWYNPFLAYALAFEIVTPDSQKFVRPATPLTRGQLAEIVYKFLTREERICPAALSETKLEPANYFEGVQLDADWPNTFYAGENFPFRGTAAGATDVTVFFVDKKTGEQTSFSAKTADGSFEIPVSFLRVGGAQLSVLPGLSGKAFAKNITILPRECSPDAVAGVSATPQILSATIVENQPVVELNLAGNNLVRVVIRQSDKIYERLLSRSQSSLSLDPADFIDFQSGGAVLEVSGSTSANGLSFEPRTGWSQPASSQLQLSQHHFSHVDADEITLVDLPTFRVDPLTISGAAKVALEPTAYLVTPAGAVEEVALSPAATIPAGANFSVDLALPEVGAYIFEINRTDGIAAVNHPFYELGTFPVLPDFEDLRQKNSTLVAESLAKSNWLKLVNSFRAKAGLPAVRLDAEISTFAEAYADRMVRENFFAHVDPSGCDPDCRRQLAGLTHPVGENLARDNSVENAHAGLLRSAAHRANILNPDWTRVGLGIATADDGSQIFVQEFSTEPLTPRTREQAFKTLFTALNSEREKVGLSALARDDQLEAAAQNWSNQLAAEEELSFELPTGSLAEEIRETGFGGGYSGFVAAASTPGQVVEALGKENHQSEFTHVAIGLAEGDDGMIRAVFVFR